MLDGVSLRGTLLLLFYQEMEKCQELIPVQFPESSINNFIIKVKNIPYKKDYKFYLENKKIMDGIIDKLLHQFGISDFRILLTDIDDSELKQVRKIITEKSSEKQKYLFFRPVILEFSKRITSSVKQKQKIIY